MADKHIKTTEKPQENPQEKTRVFEEQIVKETQQRPEVPKPVEAKLAVYNDIRNQLAALSQKIKQPEEMRQERFIA